MSKSPPALLDTKLRYCKICDNLSKVYGTLDLSETNNKNIRFSKTGCIVTYNKCEVCGILFSSSFDNWTIKDFSDHIYNEDFSTIDPSIVTGERARSYAQTVSNLFANFKASISVLDYGGGNGLFCEGLSKEGFLEVDTYDPYFGKHNKVPEKTYDLVTSFEVLEHSVHPLVTFRNLCELTNKNGVIVFTTTVLPENFDQAGLSWWYISPRGGHISIYSKQSLAIGFRKMGYSIKSFSNAWHMAYREIPDFARHLI